MDTPPTPSSTLTAMFAARVGRHPHRLALRSADGRSWSYAELRADVAALAAELARLGVRRGDRVAVLGGRTADTVVGLLGVLHAGAAYCVVDPGLPLPRRDLVLSDLAPAALVITEAGGGPPAPGSPPVARLPRGAGVVDPSWQPVDGDTDDLAYVIYTSGSTGVPKGIMVEHGSVLNMLRSYEALAPAPEEFAASLLAPPSFDVSVWEIFSALLYGGSLHVPDQRVLLDGDALCHFLAGDSIRSAYVPPGLLALFVRAAEREGTGGLARLLVGVEPIAQGLLSRLTAVMPGLRIVNGYGPTETTITATLHLVGEADDPHRRAPIGRAVAGSTVEVVDESLRPVAEGEVGEILVSGSCLARGYVDGVDRGFVEVRGRRAFRTGDFGRYLPGGVLEFSGRRDGQVKVRGFRVEVAEVEAALDAVENVRRGIVLVTGEAGAKRLVAAIEASPGVRGTDVRRRLAEQLPQHAVPSRVLVLSAFPLTANGKVDDGALLAMDRERPDAAGPFVAPRTPWESRLATAWSEVLGVGAVGIDDDFHELGGTSLDAMSIAASLRDQGDPVPAAAILSALTIRALADGSTADRSVGAAPIGPGTYPAGRAQEGLWAWRELHEGAATTTVVHAIRLDGPVDVARMRRAFAAVVSRQEALRTTFAWSADDRLEQRVSAPTAEVDLPVVRVRSQDEVDELLRLRLGERFDVTVRPWTAELVLGDGYAAFVLAADHMVFDGESAEILQKDLARAYDRPRDTPRPVSGPAALAPALIPGAERRAVLHAYWRKALADFRAMPAMPAPAPALPAGRGVRVLRREVGAGTWQAVVELARQAGSTPFVVVLAALKAFLRQRAGTASQTVTIAVSQRRLVGSEGAVGHFVNLVPVCDQVTEEASARLSFADYLATVAELARGAVEHSDLAYEDILELVPGPATAGEPGLARVVLSQQVQLAARPSTAVDGLCFRPWPGVPVNAMYDLSVFLTETDGAGARRIEWAVDLTRFAEVSPQEMADGFAAFLDAAVSAPLTPMASPAGQARDRVADGAPAPLTSSAARAAAQPAAAPAGDEPPAGAGRGATEAVIRRIWAELLEVPSVGPDDDVFELGANSMLVLAASTRLGRALSTEVPAHVVYAEPTARSLAARLTAREEPHQDDSRIKRMRRRADLVRRARLR